MKKLYPIFFTAVILIGLFIFRPGYCFADVNYRSQVDRIKTFLNQAIDCYQTGDSQKAKGLTEDAYFQVFENLEGPIRVNISAKKAYELERGFSDIRKMIVRGDPYAEIAERVRNLLHELETLVPILEKGFVLRAEKEIASPTPKVNEQNWQSISEQVLAGLEQAIIVYEQDRSQEAVGLVQDTYFDIFEASGFERALGVRNEGLKVRLEGTFSELISRMKSSGNSNHSREILTRAKSDFENAVREMSKAAESPLTIFFYSLMIILREGMEAILIITAIIAYLLKIGSRDKLKVIYHGCIWAIAASLITAFFVKEIYHLSPANQEVMEGLTVLLAAAVLFVVSYWLISKAQAQKWMSYIQHQVSQSVSKGSLRALWLVAFLAVYREGAETVLFYQALGSQSGPSGIPPIAIGFALGSALLVLVYWVLRSGARHIPIKPFFIITGLFLYYMSFVFVGKGMMELIEGKMFQPVRIAWIPPIPWLGVFPYWQTILPQFFLVFAALGAWFILTMKKSKEILKIKETI